MRTLIPMAETYVTLNDLQMPFSVKICFCLTSFWR